MNREALIDLCGSAAREAQIRDDVCSRSVLLGLQAGFPAITDDMVRMSANLCGGAASSGGTCGAFACALLALGLKYNVPLEEELKAPEKFGVGAAKAKELKGRFVEAFGSTLCPGVQKAMYGRSYDFNDAAAVAEYMAIPDHHITCAAVVEKAARICAELLTAEAEQEERK